MKKNIATIVFLMLAGFVIWLVVTPLFETRRGMRVAQKILNSGCSLEELEILMGQPTYIYSGNNVPEKIRKLDGFQMRDDTVIRQYHKEGLPYWWVLVQSAGKDSEILWYRVAEHGH